MVVMKSGSYIREELARHKSFLEEKFQVSKIGVFGSFSRGNQRKSSDVDILVDFKKPIGWDFVSLKEYLEGVLDREVDLVTVRALKPRLRDSVLKEVVYA